MTDVSAPLEIPRFEDTCNAMEHSDLLPRAHVVDELVTGAVDHTGSCSFSVHPPDSDADSLEDDFQITASTKDAEDRHKDAFPQDFPCGPISLRDVHDYGASNLSKSLPAGMRRITGTGKDALFQALDVDPDGNCGAYVLSVARYASLAGSLSRQDDAPQDDAPQDDAPQDDAPQDDEVFHIMPDMLPTECRDEWHAACGHLSTRAALSVRSSLAFMLHGCTDELGNDAFSEEEISRYTASLFERRPGPRYLDAMELALFAYSNHWNMGLFSRNMYAEERARKSRGSRGASAAIYEFSTLSFDPSFNKWLIVAHTSSNRHYEILVPYSDTRDSIHIFFSETQWRWLAEKLLVVNEGGIPVPIEYPSHRFCPESVLAAQINDDEQVFANAKKPRKPRKRAREAHDLPPAHKVRTEAHEEEANQDGSEEDAETHGAGDEDPGGGNKDPDGGNKDPDGGNRWSSGQDRV